MASSIACAATTSAPSTRCWSTPRSRWSAHHSLAAILARPGLRHLGFTQSPNLFAEPDPALVERSELVSLAVEGVDLERYGACAFPDLRSVRASWPGVIERAFRGPDELSGRIAAMKAARRTEQATQLAFVARTPHAALDLTLDQRSDLAPLREAGAAARRVGALHLQNFDVPQLRALQFLVPGCAASRSDQRAAGRRRLPARLPLRHP